MLKLEINKSLLPGNHSCPSTIVLEPVQLNQEQMHDDADRAVTSIIEGVESDLNARLIMDHEKVLSCIDTMVSNKQSHHPALRSRTTSNPSMMVSSSRSKVRTGFEKRRINSLHPHQPPNSHQPLHSFKVHSPEWLKKAHAFISGQDINSDPEEYDCNDDSINSDSIKSKSKPPRVPKRKLSRVSSRLTSHHSSSSEEWYSELPDVQEGIPQQQQLDSPFGSPTRDQLQQNPISPPTTVPQVDDQEPTDQRSKDDDDQRRASIASKAEEHTSCLKCSIM